LLLEVTPNISQDRRIVMSIFITKNDVVDPTAPEPALSTNEAKTEILVEDGDTIVIGGILKDTKKLTDQGIPDCGSCRPSAGCSAPREWKPARMSCSFLSRPASFSWSSAERSNPTK